MSEEAPPSVGADAQVASLAEQIAYHSHLYYNLAQPEISDAEFDRLWDELKQLDSRHPQLSRVGADVAPGSVKVDHLFPMRSLDKATTAEELNHFVNITTSGATPLSFAAKIGRFGPFLGIPNGATCSSGDPRKR